MSDTDKTKPYRVKLAQNPEWRVEEHDHRNGQCELDSNNIDFWWKTRRQCGYGFRDSVSQRSWARPSRVEQAYRDQANGKTRTQLRKDMRNLVKSSREDIEDCEFLSYPHRHSAIWDAW